MKLILVPGMHPRVFVDGFEIAKRATLQFLEKFKTPVVMGNEPDKDFKLKWQQGQHSEQM